MTAGKKLIQDKKQGVMLRKTSLGSENEGVLNPALMQEDDSVHYFTRLYEKVIIPV